jgi:GAF domain-containing protein
MNGLFLSTHGLFRSLILMGPDVCGHRSASGPQPAQTFEVTRMKAHLSHTLRNAVVRLADASQHTLSKVTVRLSSALRLEPAASSTPDHVMRRLESVFDALSELSFQPDIAAASDVVCDTLQAELPAAAVAAGLYDIDSDEIRIVAARGLEHDLLRGAVMPRGRCLAGRAPEEAIIVSGDADGADWIGTGEAGSTVLLCPILHDTNLLGALALAEPLCTADFSRHDLELVSYVAGQLAAFIQTHRLRPSLPAPALDNRS